MSEEVVRVLSFYRKGSEQQAGDYELVGIPLAELRAVFGAPDDDPMYEVYLVSGHRMEWLARYVAEPIDPQNYDYFLECYARERQSSPEGPPGPG